MKLPPTRHATAAPPRARGFATVEYCVVCALVMMGLFTGEPSLAAQAADAVKRYYAALTFLLSLP